MAKRGHRKSVDLALQGGGSHGAFTWGVLDRLLADERIEVGGVSGTSAGAMNAVLLASGLEKDGRDGARESLRAFWRDVGTTRTGMLHLSPFATLFQHWQSPAWALQRIYDMASRLVSPYQLNPFNFNPLRALVERHVEFQALRTAVSPRVFVSATNVRTGHPRVFRNQELSRRRRACIGLPAGAVSRGGD